VNTTSSGSEPRSAATWARARSTAVLAGAPAQWWLDGLPKCSVKYGRIASTTWGASGVLALKSR
jgi:hypothetical protein